MCCFISKIKIVGLYVWGLPSVLEVVPFLHLTSVL